MASRLRPLELAILFNEWTYARGDPIDLTIELTPHRDCDIKPRSKVNIAV